MKLRLLILMVVYCSVAWALSSCCTPERCMKKHNLLPAGQVTRLVMDSSSTEKETHTHDTDITTPADYVRPIIVINPCDTNGQLKPINIEQKGSKGRASASLKNINGALVAECACEEEKATVRRLTEENTRLSQHTCTQVVQAAPITITRTPKYASWYMLLIYAVLAYLAGRFRLIKRLYTWIRSRKSS